MRDVKIAEEECEDGMAWEGIECRGLRRTEAANGGSVSRLKDETIHLRNIKKPRYTNKANYTSCTVFSPLKKSNMGHRTITR